MCSTARPEGPSLFSFAHTYIHLPLPAAFLQTSASDTKTESYKDYLTSPHNSRKWEFWRKPLYVPCDPGVPPLGIHWKEMKSVCPRESFVRHSTFTAPLLTTAKTRRQPKCPPVGEWIKETLQTHTRMSWNTIQSQKEENPAICDNVGESGWRYTTWNKPGKDKTKYVIIDMWNFLKVRLTDTDSIMVVARGGGEMGRRWSSGTNFQLWVSSEDLIYRMVTIVNNPVLHILKWLGKSVLKFISMGIL